MRNAGGGSLKGLCPFHDEKSPSFNVTPARGFFYCFGCSEGGDVIDFVQKIDQVSFHEAVESLAARVGVLLRYDDTGAPLQKQDRNQRGRLVAAHKAAAEFYVEQLFGTPDAVQGRQFLDSRGFDKDAATQFGVGFAPRRWGGAARTPARSQLHERRARHVRPVRARTSAACTTGSAAGCSGRSATPAAR